MSSLRKDGPKPVSSSEQRPTPQSQSFQPQPRPIFYHSPHPAVEIWVDPVEMKLSVNVSLQNLPEGVSATGLQQPHSIFTTTHHGPTPAQDSFLDDWGPVSAPAMQLAESSDVWDGWGAPIQNANSWGSWGDGQEHPVSTADWGHSWGYSQEHPASTSGWAHNTWAHDANLASDENTLDGLDDSEDDWEDVDEGEDSNEERYRYWTEDIETLIMEPYLQGDDWFWIKDIDLSYSPGIYGVALMLVNTLRFKDKAAKLPPTDPMLPVPKKLRHKARTTVIARPSMQIHLQHKKALGVACMFPRQNWVFIDVCLYSCGVFGNYDLPCPYYHHSPDDEWDNCFTTWV